MNHEKGGRHNQFLDKWLKEFRWLQTIGSGDDFLMICKDCTKAGKKNAFTSGCKKFHRSALVLCLFKTGLRNRLTEQNLENLMKVATEGPPLAEFDFERAKQIFKGHHHGSDVYA